METKLLDIYIFYFRINPRQVKKGNLSGIMGNLLFRFKKSL